jgi:hypothetical protein
LKLNLHNRSQLFKFLSPSNFICSRSAVQLFVSLIAIMVLFSDATSAQAAFPVVQANNTTTIDTSQTSHSVKLPTGIQLGDLLIAGFTTLYDVSNTFPGGWTQLFSDIVTTSNTRTSIYYRQADGIEDSTITAKTDVGALSYSVAYRIAGHENPATQVLELASYNHGGSVTNSPDPQLLTPTGGVKDYLWLTIVGNQRAQITAYPTNYSIGTTKHYLYQVTFVTDSGSDSVTALTVTTANTAAIASVEIWNEAMDQKYLSTVSSPSGNDWSFNGGTAIPVDSSAASFRVVFTAKSHAALAASSYAVTGTVTSFSSTNSQAGSATDSATITVDNYPSANASWGTITLKDQQVVINWSKPEDSNFKQVVILRSTSTISDAPTDVNT